MYRSLVLAPAFALAATLLAAPAFAAGNQCSTAPAANFQPEATLKAQLKTEGLNVKRIKTEKGCYEVYAIDKAGKKVNIAFNAETLAQVSNAEAGEGN
jgi:hypothetical protein